MPLPFTNFFRKLYWLYHNHKNIQDFERFKQGIYYGPVTYSADGLVTCSNCDFIEEPLFKKAYAAAAATNPWPGFTLQWRVHIVCWFANYAKTLPGDFVECGVNTGAYARAVVEYIDFNSLGKTFFLFDTYGGFVKEQVTETEKAQGIGKYDNAYRDVYQQVQETFKDFNVRIVKGTVPSTLTACQSEKICFLSIDMNAVVPELAAAEYFWPRLVPGAVVLLDDYGFPNHITQKNAFDEFAAKRGLVVLSLPTGQGVIIKN
jgi:O-methyltransferase